MTSKYTNEQREAYSKVIKKCKDIIHFNVWMRRLEKIESKEIHNRPETYLSEEHIKKLFKDTDVIKDWVPCNKWHTKQGTYSMREFFHAYAKFRGKEHIEIEPTREGKEFWYPSYTRIEKYSELLQEWYDSYNTVKV